MLIKIGMGPRIALICLGFVFFVIAKYSGELMLSLDFLNPAIYGVIQKFDLGLIGLATGLTGLAFILSLQLKERLVPAAAVIVLVVGAIIQFAPSAIGLPLNDAILARTQLSSEQVDIEPYELVVGLTVGNESVAYPAKVLEKRLVVNDIIDGNPIVIAYCNSCKSALAYNAQVDGQFTYFQIVGTYIIDVVLEDYNTQSWWDAGTGELLAGSVNNPKLEQIPATIVQWSLWRELAPNTKYAPLSE